MSEKNSISDTEAAKLLAAEARGAVHAYGMLFEGLLNILQSKGVMSKSDVKGVFYVAAAMVDAMPAQGSLQEKMQAEIRALVCRIADNNGIKVPPAGQTGVVRKH